MSKNITTQLVACFISASLLMPGPLLASGYSSKKSKEEIKKMISITPVNHRDIKNSDVVLLSLLSAAIAGAGGIYAGSLWQRAKTNAAKDVVIAQLKERISFLNEALRLEEREERRLLKVLDEQALVFENLAKTRNPVLQDLGKAELIGFNHGYDAAFQGSQELRDIHYERGFRDGYGKKATEEFMEGKLTVFKKSGKMSKIEAEALIESLKKELSLLQGTLGSLKAATKADEQIISLMSSLNRQLLSLKKASSLQEASEIEKEILQTTQKIKNIPAFGAKKELVENFTDAVFRSLKKHGGIVSLGAVALFSVGVLMFSGEKEIAEISHKRLDAQRTLRQTYETNPALFASQTLILKEEYGIDLVSSVLYENQHYLPLLEVQVSILSCQQLGYALSVLKGGNNPQQAKQMLLNSLGAG